MGPGGSKWETLSLKAVTRCRVSDVMRYDPDARHEPVGADFRLIESSTEVH